MGCYDDRRQQVRNEAIKSYLRTHPLVKIDGENKYKTPQLIKEELIKEIQHELSFMDSFDIVLMMRHSHIQPKHLRDQLRDKTHGDIVAILLKLERMFKFKIMCSLNKKNIKKLDFSTKKPTKSIAGMVGGKMGSLHR